MSNPRDNKTLKSLQTQLQICFGEKQALGIQLNEINNNLCRKKEQIARLQESIRQFENKIKQTLIITEHAMLRYIEYRYDLTPEKIFQEIISEDLIHVYNTCGNCTVPIDHNLKAVIKDNQITTIKKDTI